MRFENIKSLYSTPENEHNIVAQLYLSPKKKKKIERKKKGEKHYVGDPVVAQWLMNPTSIDEDAGLIPGLA